MKKDLKYAIFNTDWGFFGLLANNEGVLRTTLPMKNIKDAKKYLLVGMFRGAKEKKTLLSTLQKNITDYYKRSCEDFEKSGFSLSLPQLSNFSRKVLQACKEIPLGEKITYSQLAKNAGFTNASRAAGSIQKKNPVPLLIPCHRVVRADGKIGNFSAPGGSRTKKQMLEHEKQTAARGR